MIQFTVDESQQAAVLAALGKDSHAFYEAEGDDCARKAIVRSIGPDALEAVSIRFTPPIAIATLVAHFALCVPVSSAG